jgi:hypothetical protein
MLACVCDSVYVYVYECVCVYVRVCVRERARVGGGLVRLIKLSTYVCNFLQSGCWTADPGGQKGQGVSDPFL